MDKRISQNKAPPDNVNANSIPQMREKTIVDKRASKSPPPSTNAFTSQKSFLMRSVTRNKIKSDGLDDLNEDSDHGDEGKDKLGNINEPFVQPQKLQHQFSRMGTAFIAPPNTKF